MTAALLSEYQRSVEQTLARLARQPGRPEAMAPFERLFAQGWRAEEVAGSGRPVVGVLCNFAPEELILAAGAIPLRLDSGHGGCAEAGARITGAEVCPTVRALVGARHRAFPLHGDVDLLVVPAACDAKKKLVQIIDGPTHLMELPATKDGLGASERWYEQVWALTRRLEKLCGGRIRRKALRASVELLNRRTQLYRRLLELRWARPGLLSGGDTMLVAQASFIADPAWWVEQVEALLVELADAAAVKRQGTTPLLISGAPLIFPSFGLLHLLEEAGAEVVADETCAGTQRLYNPAVLDEGSVRGMVRAVADKALLPCTCPCLVGGQDRINRVLELCRRGGARGVVLHTLRLCQLYELDQVILARALKEHEIPTLQVSTEAGSGELGPLRTRVEAFLEMLDF